MIYPHIRRSEVGADRSDIVAEIGHQRGPDLRVGGEHTVLPLAMTSLYDRRLRSCGLTVGQLDMPRPRGRTARPPCASVRHEVHRSRSRCRAPGGRPGARGGRGLREDEHRADPYLRARRRLLQGCAGRPVSGWDEHAARGVRSRRPPVGGGDRAALGDGTARPGGQGRAALDRHVQHDPGVLGLRPAVPSAATVAPGAATAAAQAGSPGSAGVPEIAPWVYAAAALAIGGAAAVMLRLTRRPR